MEEGLLTLFLSHPAHYSIIQHRGLCIQFRRQVYYLTRGTPVELLRIHHTVIEKQPEIHRPDPGKPQHSGLPWRGQVRSRCEDDNVSHVLKKGPR